jgi:hypothetical protein
MSRRRLLPVLAICLALGTSACAIFPTSEGANRGIAVSPPDPGAGQGGGGGISTKPVPLPGGGGTDPGAGQQPTIQTPTPGQFQPMAVNTWAMTPTLDGHHLTVLLTWWGGPAPCSVLDSVDVVRAAMNVTMTVVVGADPASHGQVACPAIALLLGTEVDLGELPAGTYTLATHGDLAPIEVTIP